MLIHNFKELDEAYQTEKVFDRLFITPNAEYTIKENLGINLEMLVDAYGDDGDGGYIKVIPNSISSEDGEEEYFAELAKYGLEPDGYEFDDVLVKSDTEEVHFQLFVMTEFNLLILYVKDGE
jgi:hypothetical protein